MTQHMKDYLAARVEIQILCDEFVDAMEGIRSDADDEFEQEEYPRDWVLDVVTDTFQDLIAAGDTEGVDNLARDLLLNEWY